MVEASTSVTEQELSTIHKYLGENNLIIDANFKGSVVLKET